MTPLVIIGAGGFGRECHDIVVAMNRESPRWEFLGFLDDEAPQPELMARRGTTWLGQTDGIEAFRGAAVVVGIGDPATRMSFASKIEASGLDPTTLIHPSVTVGLDVEIGQGSVLCSHVSVTTNVRIGRYVHVDQNVAVGHDSILADFSRVNPGATISGAVSLGQGAVVGTNAATLQGISIGRFAFVGAGAAVVGNVADNVTVAGVPARPL